MLRRSQPDTQQLHGVGLVFICLSYLGSRLLAFHEALEVARAPNLAQLAQRLRLDLANPFARDGEQLADLFEGAVGLADAEAHPQDLLFAWRQRRQDLAHQLAEIAPDRRLDRRWREFVLDEVAERALFLVAERGFERKRLLDELEHLLEPFERNLHLLGDLLGARVAPEALAQHAR